MKLLSTLTILAVLLAYTTSRAQTVSTKKDVNNKGKIVSTTDANNKTNRQAGTTMKGVYLMLRQVANDGTNDSLIPNKQLKIYTDRYMMYAHPAAGDSMADFGIGTYEIKNGKVNEFVFHTAASGAQKDTFELSISKTADGYRQVIIFPEYQGKKWTLIEDYKNVGKNVTSPLDGAWKQTKSIYIPKIGNTTTNNNPIQFKIYQSGYLIWARTWVDSALNKPVSSFGYGTFEMNGKTQSKETYSSSTSKTGLVGNPVTVQLEFLGKNSYQQTIDWPNGRSIEVYERLR